MAYQITFKVLSSVLVLCLINISLSSQQVDEYFKERRKLIKKSQEQSIGGNLTLDENEKNVNNILMIYKIKEFKQGIKNPTKFPAAQHFFRAKPYIEESCVFKIIQKLPKGASLHSHDTALVSDTFVFENITYRDNLYAIDDKKSPISLKFFKKNPGAPWLPISEWRDKDPTFNTRLKHNISLVVENPEVAYSDMAKVWNAFQNIFYTIEPLLTYKPVFRDYYYQALKELYEDNIRYLEFRGILPDLYDLDGNIYGPEEVVKLYYETTREFMKDYPDFWGVKFIFAPMRYIKENVVENYVDFVEKIISRYPRFIAGFDLVGREDTGPPLKDFIPALLRMGSITNFFFHAGETLWYGMPVDFNLFDAILLNTSRIGHGYAALKHPEILRIIKEKNIALEISPISNQVLGLVSDIQNHPANFLIANNYPVVITQDDPGLWGAKAVLGLVSDIQNHPANFLIANNYPVVITQDDPGLWGAKAVSYDWYYAFMGMASRHSDLRLLKQLAINSIVYSRMDSELKQKAIEKWKVDWNAFIKETINGDLALCKP